MSLGSDTYHLFIRALKKVMRNPILLFFSLLQPIIFLVLFTQLFSKFAAVPGLFPSGITYLEYATPGILLQNGFSSALQSGTSIVDELNSGMLEKMLVTPVNRSAILLGRLLSDAFRVVVQSAIILILAYILGFNAASGPGGIILMLGIIALFGLAWSGISLAIGLRTRSAETVFGIGGFLTFPLLFMSTALVPVGAMPSWMASISNVNPISFAVNAVRGLSLPSGTLSGLGLTFPGDIISALAYIAVIAIITLGATLYLFRKVVK
ncbi:MAG TPA: ABC transporter permease [Nitrososphaerales archaeon]|nr:ABC transporter permease [Nitrososphaerales archaeon]